MKYKCVHSESPVIRLSDEKLANHVVWSHRRAECLHSKGDLAPLRNSNYTGRMTPLLDSSSPGESETTHLWLHARNVDVAKAHEPLPQGFIRRFITHARTTCEPRLHSIDQDKISNLYADLRRESATCGGVPIAVRHLESLMRMAEAHVYIMRVFLNPLF